MSEFYIVLIKWCFNNVCVLSLVFICIETLLYLSSFLVKPLAYIRGIRLTVLYKGVKAREKHIFNQLS